jgi:hypothetical protein
MHDDRHPDTGYRMPDSEGGYRTTDDRRPTTDA